jgi:hypothetical protein
MINPAFFERHEARREMVSPPDSGRGIGASTSSVGSENGLHDGDIIEGDGFEVEMGDINILVNEIIESPESPPLH